MFTKGRPWWLRLREILQQPPARALGTHLWKVKKKRDLDHLIRHLGVWVLAFLE